ncbi:MAG: hypothetical protein NUV54_00170 [Candidatus Taylorbacteria bacterium]|nr:hypothetical protein [Candidatus Taylorbacteria bacterium]
MKNNSPREITHKGNVLAIVFSKTTPAEGVCFLTPTHYPLQIGLIDHKEGKNVPLHVHKDMRYKVNTTQEFLYVIKGEAKVTLATKQWEVLEHFTLHTGDFVLFVSGAHGVDIKKGSRLIEVKQGPYPGDDYAKRFQK